MVPNKDKMKRKLKILGRKIQIEITDSKLWNTTSSDLLPERLITVAQRSITSLINNKSIIKGRLGNQIAMKLQHNRKTLAIINLYRIPRSLSNGVYYCLIQYNKIDRKAKIIKDYRKEILDEIEKYIKKNSNINNIITAGDLN